MDPHKLGWQLQEPLRNAHDALQGEQAENINKRFLRPTLATWTTEDEDDNKHCEAKADSKGPVPLDHPTERVMACNVKPWHDLASS